MCGIAGVVGGDPRVRRPQLARAIAVLAHRGPDGQHSFESERADLAHTRLAIIDPSTASDQPMVDPHSGCALVYNGEIYNYVELRRELEARHHRFFSSGDTEVLLRSYLEWGAACVEHLNGMFAFAVWDPRADGLFLARDRLGEKPLHLSRNDDRWWFASEIKALLAAGVVDARANPGYLFRFLAMGDLGHPEETPFAGVRQLRAGHCGWVTSSGELRTWPYWNPAESDLLPPKSGDEVDQRFADLFSQSVMMRLRSDVALGTSLSGGLDSSLVIAMVRHHQPQGELHAFTASFPNTPADELPYAAALADRLGVTLHPVSLGPGDLDADLDRMTWANEGPVEATSVFAQFRVMEEARRAGITVLLDGQGADETMGGYEKYASEEVLDLVARGHIVKAIRSARDWRAVRGSLPGVVMKNYVGLMGGPGVRRGLNPLVTKRAGWLAPDFRHAHRGRDVLEGLTVPRVSRGGSAAANSLLDLERAVLPRLLRYGDRNSMAWSREVRLPYLDHRLIQLANATPMSLKIRNGWSKEPIRGALERLGHPDVARRRFKKNYMPPNEEWLGDPRIASRIQEAWTRLHDDGLLAHATPAGSINARWRVLSVESWRANFGVSWA